MELATVPVTVVITDKLDDEDNKPSLEKTRFEAKNTDLTPLFYDNSVMEEPLSLSFS